jgi:hypothetical protein
LTEQPVTEMNTWCDEMGKPLQAAALRCPMEKIEALALLDLVVMPVCGSWRRDDFNYSR